MLLLRLYGTVAVHFYLVLSISMQKVASDYNSEEIKLQPRPCPARPIPDLKSGPEWELIVANVKCSHH